MEWLNHAPQNILKIGGHNIKYVEIERFSIECHKTKTKIITTTNQKEYTSKRQWEHKEPNCPKRGKTRATKSWLRPTGWEDDASFLDQSQSEVKQNQCNPRLISTLNWKLLCLEKETYLANQSYCFL